MTLRALYGAGLAAVALGFAAPASAQESVPAFEDRDLERLASPELTTFASEQAFVRYLREVDRVQRKRRTSRRGWRGSQAEPGLPEIVVAQADVAEPECIDPELCPSEELPEIGVVVTGSRVATPTITNVQVARVDEGDIVKQIGEYLLVLQDGRIFALHYPTMRLTDRMDVYRRDGNGRPAGADGYDEMLVQGDQVIITAYSYEDQASEISVFRLDESSGRLERRGVLLITSDDYYDIDNYATRIIGDRLVIHTPYEAEQVADRRSRPVVRRWDPAKTHDEAVRAGRQLFDARDIYRPVFAVEEPIIHTISVCPLGEVAQRGLECRSTAIVGTELAEMFVTPEAIYLWLPAFSGKTGGRSSARRSRAEPLRGWFLRRPSCGFPWVAAIPRSWGCAGCRSTSSRWTNTRAGFARWSTGVDPIALSPTTRLRRSRWSTCRRAPSAASIVSLATACSRRCLRRGRAWSTTASPGTGSSTAAATRSAGGRGIEAKARRSRYRRPLPFRCAIPRPVS
jgi:hypothetical protein